LAILEYNEQEALARVVSDFWYSRNMERHNWLEQINHVLRYTRSPSTSTTQNSSLPWKNNTTIPKLTQIADNLVAYYQAAMFPNDDWFVFEGSNPEAQKKGNLIEDYLKSKLTANRFEEEVVKCLRDWVYTGVAFAGVVWEEETTVDFVTGEKVKGYVGPRLFRVSPMDAMIDPKASNYTKSYFLRREVIHISELMEDPMFAQNQAILQRIAERRTSFQDEEVDDKKRFNLQIDGFDTARAYMQSGYVELLTYCGNIYNPENGEYLLNQEIYVVDRSDVLLQRTNPSYLGIKPYVYSGWRVLPDNLYGQGPLAQLVGMQYRCDHLENLKADAFDMIIHPQIKIMGETVEDFQYGPGQRIYCGDEGDVQFLSPDTSVLTCDNQIAIYHRYMEEMAGSPKESMGFRTPGEKTAFEVNVLQQGADRMFIQRLNQFEREFIEPALNLMFELLVRNMNGEDIVRTFNDLTKTEEMFTITQEDVAARGVLKPIGSRHYSARNKRVQELQNFLSLGEASGMSAHISKKRAAKLLEEELGLEEWDLVQDNIGVQEEVETQVAAALAQRLGEQQLAGIGGLPRNEEQGTNGRARQSPVQTQRPV